MNAQLFLYGFAPLLVYILIDYWKGFRAGVIAAIVTSLMICVVDYVYLGELDYFVIGETALIVLLGYVSLKMNQDRYFKFQPVVVAAIFTVIFAYFQLFDKPLFLRYLPRMEQLMVATAGGNPEAPEIAPMLEMLHQPAIIEMFGKLSGACIGLFFLHGLIMAYAALRLSTGAWFAWRLAIYPGLLLLVIYYRATLA